MSISSPNPNSRSLSPTLPKLVVAPNDDSEEWITSWTNTRVEGVFSETCLVDSMLTAVCQNSLTAWLSR